MAAFGGSDTRINATFTASDKASPVIKGLRREVSALGTKTGGPLGGLLSGIGGLSVGALGAVAGVGALAAGLASATGAAIDDQKSQMALNAALKANVPAWDGSTKAVEDAIQAGQDLAFADDDVRASIQALIPRTHDISKAITLTRQAMDLARLKGISLADAAGLLGKVFSGQVSAARRAGLAIDKTADSTQALAQIQQAAAGQASTYAESTAGNLERIGIIWSEFTEGIGYGVLALVDGISDIADAVGGLNDILTGHVTVSNEMETALRKQAAAMGLDADAAVEFYEAQLNVQKAQEANARATLDTAIRAEHAADATKSYDEIAAKLGTTIDEVSYAINVLGDGWVASSSAVTDLTGYTEAAIGVLNQYENSVQGVTDAQKAESEARAESYRLQEENANWSAPLIAEMRHVSNASRTMSAVTIESFDLMTGGISGELKRAKNDAKTQVNQLWYNIRHPGELARNREALAKQMRRAHKALLAAEKTGDANVIEEAQTLVDNLNATWQNLNGTVTINARIDSYNQSHHALLEGGRASGGPVQRGSTYLVGENGPEVLHMGGGSGYVTQGTGNAGGAWEHTTVVMLDGAVIARQVDRWNGRQFQVAGRSHSRN